MRTSSNRELARHIGVSETAVRRAEKAGRIKREPDGAWDLARVKAAWARNTDRAQQRRQRPTPEEVPPTHHGVREAVVGTAQHQAVDLIGPFGEGER